MTLLTRQTPKSAVACAISRGAKSTSSTLPCQMCKCTNTHPKLPSALSNIAAFDCSHRRGNASPGIIMVRHALNQRLHRDHPHVPAQLQHDRRRVRELP